MQLPDQHTTAELRPDCLLIGLVGPAGAGKDTAADRLCEQHGFVRHAFAEPLRDMVQALMASAGVDAAWMLERHLKETPMPVVGTSARHLLQTLGTEWGRGLIDPELWVRLAAHALGLTPEQAWTPVHDRIVITDVRMHNEAAWIRRLGGYVVRVVRDTKPVRPHDSEMHMGHITSWARISNTGTLRDLDDAVDELVQHIEAHRAAQARGTGPVESDSTHHSTGGRACASSADAA